MYKPEYPEFGRREMMLWAVYEWCQNRPANQDVIQEYEVATLVGGGEYVRDPLGLDPDKQAAVKEQAEQVRLFVTLVNEGLIDADILHPPGRPILQALLRGLHEPGLKMIQELPDPQQAVINSMEQLADAIRNLKDVPDEKEKEAAEKAAKEIGSFVRNAAPTVAVQLLIAQAKNQGWWP